MIVVDTSALMAVLVGEPESSSCMDVLAREDEFVISAGTLAEALIVAGRRGVAIEMEQLVNELGMNVVPVTAATARRVADAYARWGKGIDPAGLNFGDCFAYVEASNRACPLLFAGEDFRKTGIVPARRH